METLSFNVSAFFARVIAKYLQERISSQRGTEACIKHGTTLGKPCHAIVNCDPGDDVSQREVFYKVHNCFCLEFRKLFGRTCAAVTSSINSGTHKEVQSWRRIRARWWSHNGRRRFRLSLRCVYPFVRLCRSASTWQASANVHALSVDVLLTPPAAL